MPKTTKPTDHAAAEKRARKAEARKLAGELKKLDSAYNKLVREQKRERASQQARHKRELSRLGKLQARDLKKAEANYARESRAIFRRLEILNGRGL